MRKWMPPIIAFLVIVAASVAGGYLARPHHTTIREDNAQEELRNDFEQALQTIEENYAGAADLEALGRNSVQGMLQQLDPHSQFFTKAQFDDLQTEQRSHFFGIGVTIKRINGRVYILSAAPDGPAFRAGLRYGDSVVAVDGQAAEDWVSEQVMARVRGEKGEPVELTVERAGAPRPITVRMTRGDVKLPSVRNWFMIGQTTTGYVGLTGGFSGKTDEELNAALSQLKKEGMQQLILDLRNNPGGLLDQAIKVAEKFLKPGKRILEVRGRDDRYPDHSYVVPENNVPELMPMVILINQRTASASEVVAGALQDHDRAYIVGESSFGKGLVQSIFYLWGGTGLTLTTQKYYTPTGRSIQRDYSKVSFYDYYLNRRKSLGDGANLSLGSALYTDLGRTVFGGGGISPDEKVKASDSDRVTFTLFNGIFDFVRQLVAGQLAAFREYRINETQYKNKPSPEEIDRYPANEKLIDAFRVYIAEKPQFKVTEDQFNGHLDYIKRDMRREIVTAAYGPEAGDMVYLLDDAQLRRAMDKLPEARQLAENSSRIRDRQ
jgi:carboxyl-terminal processing protease